MKILSRKSITILLQISLFVVIPLAYIQFAAGDASRPIHTHRAAKACGKAGVLVGLDGGVPIFDTPENRIIRFHLPVGTKVRVIDAVEFEGTIWCLVEPWGDAGQGWVTVEALKRLQRVPPRNRNRLEWLKNFFSPYREPSPRA